MSSFVVSKEEMVKAAGFLSALSEATNRFDEPLLRVWDYKKGHVLHGVDYLETFERLHYLNALSVQKQYDDPEMFLDSNDYAASFQKMQDTTRTLLRQAFSGRSRQLEKAVYKFHHFCASIKYQVEDPKAFEEVRDTLDHIEVGLVGVLQSLPKWENDTDSWGEFSLAV